MAHDRLKKFADAVLDWGQAVRLSDQAERPQLRTYFALSMLKAGQEAEAVAEVAELRKLPGWNPDDHSLYNFACGYSVLSAKLSIEQSEYADAAMQLLQQAVNAGWNDYAHIKANRLLDPLRQREDFKKLLADLEAKYPLERLPLPRPAK